MRVNLEAKSYTVMYKNGLNLHKIHIETKTIDFLLLLSFKLMMALFLKSKIKQHKCQQTLSSLFKQSMCFESFFFVNSFLLVV